MLKVANIMQDIVFKKVKNSMQSCVSLKVRIRDGVIIYLKRLLLYDY